MSNVLEKMRDVIQADPGNRGLASVAGDNLLTACAGNFANACASIANRQAASVGVVTGFFIPTGQPPCGETDGPLGALFLARALVPAGIRVVLATDPFCMAALSAGLSACGLSEHVPLVEIPSASEFTSAAAYRAGFAERAGPLTHLIALERVGPTHTPATVSPELLTAFTGRVGAAHRGRCHTMRGRDITLLMRPAHLLFEAQPVERPETIGIGDGGNEIGMGRISWDVIRRNILGGDLVACRTPCDHLIVCGVSNWGAYALAAGVLHLRGAAPPPDLFGVDRERELLRIMVETGPLVDGVRGVQDATVDGLPFERYAEVLRQLDPLRSGEPAA